MSAANTSTDILKPLPPNSTAAGGEVYGQPRGLVYIGGTELWERVSFHGMQALLVLYMVEQLLLPGHIEHILGFDKFRAALESVTGPLSVQALASQIFGLYVGLVYLIPVGGGALGDRLLGRRRAVMLGAILMTIGHGCIVQSGCYNAPPELNTEAVVLSRLKVRCRSWSRCRDRGRQ